MVQLIVLLYLIDNNENTSWMILMGSGMGVLIEAWKVIDLGFFFLSYAAFLTLFLQITKAVDIRLVPAPAGSTLPYKLDIKGTSVYAHLLRRPTI